MTKNLHLIKCYRKKKIIKTCCMAENKSKEQAYLTLSSSFSLVDLLHVSSVESDPSVKHFLKALEFES